MAVEFFGQWLVGNGYIRKNQLHEALKVQEDQNIQLGARALSAGYIDQGGLEKILERQREVDQHFGEAAVGLGILRQEQVDELLHIQLSERIYLGEALISIGALNREDLDDYLAAFNDIQENAMDAIRLPDSLDHHECFILSFVSDMLMKTFRRVAREHLKLAACTDKVKDFEHGDATVTCSFSGSRKFRLRLSTAGPLSIAMAMGIAGKRENLKQVVAECLKEFVGINARQIASGFSNLGQPLDPGEVTEHDGDPTGGRHCVAWFLAPTGKAVAMISFD